MSLAHVLRIAFCLSSFRAKTSGESMACARSFLRFVPVKREPLMFGTQKQGSCGMHNVSITHIKAIIPMASTAPKEPPASQAPVRRIPRQERSLTKVEFMLEAAIQLLDEAGLELFTTKAVAAKAGVSIGTLYQYFDDKQALLDALVARELGALAKKITGTMKGAAPSEPGDRVRRIMAAVVGAYGGRGRVHRMLMEHALSQVSSRPLSPLYPALMQLLTTQGVAAPHQATRKLTQAQAFVLTHAVGGILRTLVASEHTPPRREVEDALVELVLGYMGPVAEAKQPSKRRSR
jgi:AcrR family transcriptional regulator